MNKQDSLIKIHAYVSSDGIIDNWKSKDLHGKKIRIRKKLRTRFYNNEEKLIQDFIKTIKKLYPLKSIKFYPKRSEIEIRSQVLAKDLLKLGEVSSKSWEVPKNIEGNQKAVWIKAFADCDGTIYDKNYNRYVAIDPINLKGLKQISKILEEFNIKNKIYIINYKGKTSYRLKISRKDNLIKFNKIIGFNHPKKKRKLIKAINSYKQKL